MELGRTYRLNAPWHHRHGCLVFVACSRPGISEAYAGRTVYHIIDTDSFAGGVDMDEEYVEENFTEAGPSTEELKILVKYVKTQGRQFTSELKITSLSLTVCVLKGKFFSLYERWKPNSMEGRQLGNIVDMFDEDCNYTWVP